MKYIFCIISPRSYRSNMPIAVYFFVLEHNQYSFLTFHHDRKLKQIEKRYFPLLKGLQ